MIEEEEEKKETDAKGDDDMAFLDGIIKKNEEERKA